MHKKGIIMGWKYVNGLLIKFGQAVKYFTKLHPFETPSASTNESTRISDMRAFKMWFESEVYL